MGTGCAAANAAFGILNAVEPGCRCATTGRGQRHDVPAVPQPRLQQLHATTSRAIREACLSGTAKLVYRAQPRTAAVCVVCPRATRPAGSISTASNAPSAPPAVRQAARPCDHTDQQHVEFGDETNNSFEVGEKATLFNRKLLLNATLFYQKYKGFQLNTFNGLVFVVTSVPSRSSARASMPISCGSRPRQFQHPGRRYLRGYPLQPERRAACHPAGARPAFLGGEPIRGCQPGAVLVGFAVRHIHPVPIGENYVRRGSTSAAKYSSGLQHRVRSRSRQVPGRAMS